MPAGDAALAGEEGVGDAGQVEIGRADRGDHGAGLRFGRLGAGSGEAGLCKPGRPASSGRADGEHLEELAHAGRLRAGEPLDARTSTAAAPARAMPGARARRRARARPSAARNAPCVTGPCTAAPGALRGARQRGEIDMDGEVRLAGIGQHVARRRAPSPPAACRRSRTGHGRSRWRAARRPARRCGRRASGMSAVAASADLDHRSLRRGGLEGRLGLRREAEGEAGLRRRARRAARTSPRPVRTNWRTGRASKNSLATNSAGPWRQRLEQSSCQATGNAGLCQRLALPLAQHGARLDEMHARRCQERRQDARGAQRVGHQRAASGTEFDEHEARRARPCGSRCRRTTARSARRTSARSRAR